MYIHLKYVHCLCLSQANNFKIVFVFVCFEPLRINTVLEIEIFLLYFHWNTKKSKYYYWSMGDLQWCINIMIYLSSCKSGCRSGKSHTGQYEGNNQLFINYAFHLIHLTHTIYIFHKIIICMHACMTRDPDATSRAGF